MTVLPPSWHTRAVGDIADIVRGVTYKKSDAKSTPGPGYSPLLRATNIGSTLNLGGELVYVPTAGVKAQQFLRSGDIVLASSSGSLSVVGKNARLPADWDGTFGAFCAVIRSRQEVDSRYLALYLSSDQVRRRWSEAARGTNINNLKKSDLAPTPVPLPPLEEQWRIADILEDHLSRLDAAHADLARASSAIGVMNLSVLNDIRGTLLDLSVPLKRLGDACSTSLGKMLDAKKASGTPTPYLRNINVRWGGFDLSDVKTVLLGDAERVKFDVKPGDLLVCEGGEPGRCAVWVDGPSGITYQKALHRVRAKDPSRVAPDFVALLLEEFIRMGRADRMFTGTTIRHLPQEKLRVIELPVPDLQTQRATVDRVTTHIQATARLASELGRVAHEGTALRRALLGAAFSGRLTGRATDMDMVEEMAGV